MNTAINNFNLRVYGLFINENKVLISHEVFRNQKITKFPGGGIEYGEGITAALQREWKEELGIQIQVNELIYLTDYFIQSAFREEDQLISFYYKISTKEYIPENSIEHQFEWISINKKILNS